MVGDGDRWGREGRESWSWRRTRFDSIRFDGAGGEGTEQNPSETERLGKWTAEWICAFGLIFRSPLTVYYFKVVFLVKQAYTN
jgi:hypothetical protein